MIPRRPFFGGMAATLIVVGLADAQQSARVYRIGLLRAGPIPKPWPSHEAFLTTLRESGFVQGSNLVIEIRAADGRYERLSALADDLVRAHADVIVAATTACVLAAKHATKTVPVVMVNVAGPRELLPGAKRVVMFRSPNPASTVFPPVEKMAEKVGLTLEVVEVRSFKELEDAFAKFGPRKPDAVWCGQTPSKLAA